MNPDLVQLDTEIFLNVISVFENVSIIMSAEPGLSSIENNVDPGQLTFDKAIRLGLAVFSTKTQNQLNYGSCNHATDLIGEQK